MSEEEIQVTRYRIRYTVEHQPSGRPCENNTYNDDIWLQIHLSNTHVADNL